MEHCTVPSIVLLCYYRLLFL